jgi:hypothetical protein
MNDVNRGFVDKCSDQTNLVGAGITIAEIIEIAQIQLFSHKKSDLNRLFCDWV